MHDKRVDPGALDFMFKVAGVDKEKLHAALRTMGTKHIKGPKEIKDQWSPENPTFFYCYVVSEMLYWYVAPKGTIPMAVKVPGDPGLHRFLQWPGEDSNGKFLQIIDLTCDQFSDINKVDYSKAKKCMFLQTGCKGPSKRARILAELMGYKEWKPKTT